LRSINYITIIVKIICTFDDPTLIDRLMMILTSINNKYLFEMMV
jgi:hypothetical protein